MENKYKLGIIIVFRIEGTLREHMFVKREERKGEIHILGGWGGAEERERQEKGREECYVAVSSMRRYNLLLVGPRWMTFDACRWFCFMVNILLVVT